MDSRILPHFLRNNARVSVSESLVGKVTDYIAKQKQHHHKESFENEFVAILEKHGIDVERKYLWT